jgi:D-3-phosphoglycerate dehydrogenase
MSDLVLPLVVVTEGSEARPMAWLRQHARVIEAASQSPELPEALADADGLVVRTYTRVTEAFLEGAPKLKVIGRGGVGLDNIDVPACRRRGVQVVYTPDANTLAVGDFVIGIMLQLLRPWHPFRETSYPPAEFKRIRDTVRGRQLNELTLGILGMGRVGRRVGRIVANGFGMRVIYHDLLDVSDKIEFAAESVDCATLYRQSDVLSIHIDGRAENRHVVNAEALAQLPATSILINTSRGEVLDAHALSDRLRSGHLAGAALDVYDPEPPRGDFPLLGLPNVLLTPHLAARTHTALENMSWVVRDVMAVLAGQPPKYPAL